MGLFDETIAGNIIRLNRKDAEMGDINAQKVILVARLWLELLEKDTVSCEELLDLYEQANKVEELKPSLSYDMCHSIKAWHYKSCILPNLPTQIDYDSAASINKEIYLILEPVKEVFTLRGHNTFVRIAILIEPFLGDKHFRIEWKVDENVIPKSFIEYVFEGIKKASLEEFELNKQVLHLKISIIDGVYHETDSHGMAYQRAVYSAYKNALTKAKIEKL